MKLANAWFQRGTSGSKTHGISWAARQTLHMSTASRNLGIGVGVEGLQREFMLTYSPGFLRFLLRLACSESQVYPRSVPCGPSNGGFSTLPRLGNEVSIADSRRFKPKLFAKT